ncbi:MAG: LamG-like jellyroll fold domain-containing protein [Ferruginibacter sp.]
MKNNINIIAVFFLCFTFFSCKKTDSDTALAVNAAVPTVTTNDATNVSAVSATLGGNITNDGGSMVSESGICYSKTPGVTISNNKTPNYTISGNFSVTISNLDLLSTYYYRAYAINDKGVVLGAEKSFFVPVNGYTASSQVAAANLKAYWAFENGYIDSVSKTMGTANHPAALSFVNGIIGKAVQVQSPGYINSNITNTVANLGSFSIVCWVMQPASLASGPTTYMPFSLNNDGYSWENTKLFMLFNNADDASNSYGKVCMQDQWFDKGQVWPKMLDGKWHQMAISYNNISGDLRIYIDGALLSQSSTATFSPQTNFGAADSFTLGGPDDNTNTANGWMNSLSGNLDEFKIFNKELTVSEVQSLYALQLHGL